MISYNAIQSAPQDGTVIYGWHKYRMAWFPIFWDGESHMWRQIDYSQDFDRESFTYWVRPSVFPTIKSP